MSRTSRLAHFVAAGCAVAALSGNAYAESCVETVIRLQAAVASLPPADPSRPTLASTLETARAADAKKCEQITIGVEQALAQRSPDASRQSDESRYSGSESSADASDASAPGAEDDDDAAEQ